MDGRAVQVASTASSWTHTRCEMNGLFDFHCFHCSEIRVYPFNFPRFVSFPSASLYLPFVVTFLSKCCSSLSLPLWRCCQQPFAQLGTLFRLLKTLAQIPMLLCFGSTSHPTFSQMLQFL